MTIILRIKLAIWVVMSQKNAVLFLNGNFMNILHMQIPKLSMITFIFKFKYEVLFIFFFVCVCNESVATQLFCVFFPFCSMLVSP